VSADREDSVKSSAIPLITPRLNFQQFKRLANLFEISVDANDQTHRVEGDVEPSDLVAEISWEIDPGTGSIFAENLDREKARRRVIADEKSFDIIANARMMIEVLAR